MHVLGMLRTSRPGQSLVPVADVAGPAAAAGGGVRRNPSPATSPGMDHLAGLAMLLEASEESPFRTDCAAVAGAVGRGDSDGGVGAGGRPEGGAGAGARGAGRERGGVGKHYRRGMNGDSVGALGSPLRPLALNGGGCGGGGNCGVSGRLGSPDMAKGWGEGARRKRTHPAGAAHAHVHASVNNNTSWGRAGSGETSDADAEADGGADTTEARSGRTDAAAAAAAGPSSKKRISGKEGRATVGSKSGCKAPSVRGGGVSGGVKGGSGKSGGVNTKGGPAGNKKSSAAAAARAAAATASVDTVIAAAASGAGGVSGLAPTVLAVATAAPQVVLNHALRWIDLLVADLKGRGAALRRSRRRLQKVKAETEGDGLSAGGVAADAGEESRATAGAGGGVDDVRADSRGGVAATVAVEEATLLRDLDRALAAEGRGIDALLRQTSELRAIAAGELIPAAPAALVWGAGDEHEGIAVGKRGRPRGWTGAAAGAVAGSGDTAAAAGSTLDCYAPVTALLAAAPPLNDAKLMTDYFRDAAVASAAAFISTAVKVAAAEGDGDVGAAAAVACPAGLLPTPHIVRGR